VEIFKRSKQNKEVIENTSILKFFVGLLMVLFGFVFFIYGGLSLLSNSEMLAETDFLAIGIYSFLSILLLLLGNRLLKI
jgi:hypothetical protein